MGREKNFRPGANPELAAAMRELRKGSRTSPHETKDKRLRTDERVIAAELELEQDVVHCSKCGSPDHVDVEEDR